MNCCDYGCVRAHNFPAGSVVIDDAYTGLMARQWASARSHARTPSCPESDDRADQPTAPPISAAGGVATLAALIVSAVAIATFAAWPTLGNLFQRIFN